ncbi:MAG: outer membrane lipoprotein-sorting protein [Candidatus Binatia bacterium]
MEERGQFPEAQPKTERQRFSKLRIVAPLIVGVLGTLLFGNIARAAEDQSYKALRNWIEAHRPDQPTFAPGQRLSLEDRKALEPFIPQTAWEYYFFDRMEMEIAATAKYPFPEDWGRGLQEGAQLDENGVLVGFTGHAIPFPDIQENDPQAAVKVIWNMLWRPGADDYNMPMVTWLRGPNGQLDRELEFVSVNTRYSRGDNCLVPGYEEVKSKSLMEFRAPRDMAGTKNLSVNYVDHYKEDDGWLYMPSQRKPRRVLASERTSELMGMDMIREDQMGFGGKVFENTWTYLGKKAVLATINVRDNPEIGGPHLWVPNKARWEVREAHVLLVEPKSPTHPYSHKIIFIDAETHWTLWMFAFDRKEQLLRMNQHFLKYSESYAQEPAQQARYLEQDFSNNVGTQVFLHLGETDINAQKPHATITHCYVVRRDFSPGRAKQFYSVRNMVSGKR